MRSVRPNVIFDLIKLILDEESNLSHQCRNKAEFDLVLLIATKLFSFPLATAADVADQKKNALYTLQLALKNKHY